MANCWYVRPLEDGTNGDGTTYELAWRGLSNIVWSNIQPGDTLFVCGKYFNYSSGLFTDKMTIGASGSEGSPIKIIGSLGDPGTNPDPDIDQLQPAVIYNTNRGPKTLVQLVDNGVNTGIYSLGDRTSEVWLAEIINNEPVFYSERYSDTGLIGCYEIYDVNTTDNTIKVRTSSYHNTIVSVDVSTDKIRVTSAMTKNMRVMVGKSDTSTLPSPLVEDEHYYVANTYTIDDKPWIDLTYAIGGPVIDLTTTGSGTRWVAHPPTYQDSVRRYHMVEVDTTSDKIKIAGSIAQGTKVRVGIFDSGTLPEPLAADTDYYIKSIESSSGYYLVQLSTTPEGGAIDLTTTGSGNIYITTLWQDSDVYYFSDGDKIVFSGQSYPTTWGKQNTIYYVKNRTKVADNYIIQIATSPGGSPLTLSKPGGPMGVLRLVTSYDLLSPGEFIMQYGGYNSAFRVYAKSISGVYTNKHLYLFGPAVIVATDKSYISVLNIDIYGGGFELTGCSNIIVKKCKMHYATGDAARVKGPGSNYLFEDNYVYECVNGIYGSKGTATGAICNNFVVRNNQIILSPRCASYYGTTYDNHCIANQAGTGNLYENNVCIGGKYSISFYTGTLTSQSPDAIIRNNFVMDQWQHYVGIAHLQSTNSPTQKLVDPLMDFAAIGIVEGDKVRNCTTGAIGTVTVIETTINPNDTLVATLTGGTRQTWQKGDIYQTRHDTMYVAGAGIDSSGQSDVVTTYVKIYSNVIINGDSPGIRITNAENRDSEIYNNTIYNCAIGIGLNSYDNGQMQRMKVYNNIICNPRDTGLLFSPGFYYYLSAEQGIANTVYINNQCFYPNPGDSDPFAYVPVYYGTPLTKTKSQWLSIIRSQVSSNESSSIFVNPALINPGGVLATDYKISNDSPCKWAGTAVGLTADYAGTPWHSPPSIGAFEIASALRRCLWATIEMEMEI